MQKNLETLYLNLENLYKKLHKVLRPLSSKFRPKLKKKQLQKMVAASRIRKGKGKIFKIKVPRNNTPEKKQQSRNITFAKTHD